MKTNRTLAFILAIAFGIAAGSGAAHAQKQTAAGAQKFLASLGKDGGATPLVSGLVPISKRMMQGDVLDTEWSADYNARFVQDAASIETGADLCHTKATSKQVDVGSLNAGEPGGWHKVFVAKSEPVFLVADIDWSRAVIKRGAFLYHPDNFGQVADFLQGEKAITAQIGDDALEFRSEDPELLDRIEFAMKFLKASCDRAADTGF
jgi:hypothetical protein